MFEFHCVPIDDAQFANCVRAVAVNLRDAGRKRAIKRSPWEAPLRAAFGYRGAEARIQALTDRALMVTVYRDGAPRLVANRRRVRGLGPVG
jgi:hypothetical protein